MGDITESNAKLNASMRAEQHMHFKAALHIHGFSAGVIPLHKCVLTPAPVEETLVPKEDIDAEKAIYSFGIDFSVALEVRY